ncbi:conserved protein of unknown function [Streptantibioticus cattleyicolor NRRL 8057 = DSM 46488]|nr:conserved protein of unknown function [Streptantibioticus cattleyicolor NRRL 8057 = DSM 46488]
MVISRGDRIGYADEHPYDRDADGVLWTRVPSSPGRGRPEFGTVHALRQRRAMRRLLCQVCARPADRDAEGVLWLITEDPAAPDSWPRPLTTTHPPVCLSCAARSLRVCPRLRAGCVALRVSACAPVGVHGALYGPGGPLPVVTEVGGVRYGDPRIRRVRAGQLVMCLEGWTRAAL